MFPFGRISINIIIIYTKKITQLLTFHIIQYTILILNHLKKCYRYFYHRLQIKHLAKIFTNAYKYVLYKKTFV